MLPDMIKWIIVRIKKLIQYCSLLLVTFLLVGFYGSVYCVQYCMTAFRKSESQIPIVLLANQAAGKLIVY